MINGERVETVINNALTHGKGFLGQGKVATYIPELSKADPMKLGICLTKENGEDYAVGDYQDRFTMQSISKVVTLLVALETAGYDKVFSKVGMEPTGDAFNSIIKLETNTPKPLNPMINAGAIVITGCINSADPFDSTLKLIHKLCGSNLPKCNDAVYLSEKMAGNRNRAMGYFLKGEGFIEGDVESCLDTYFRLCSVEVSAKELAHMGLVLALDGRCPISGRQIIQSWQAKIAKALMMTCGMYDGSGAFAVKVGMPSKSGVGGGILSLVNGKLGIGVYAPALDEKGNSLCGSKVLEYISNNLHLNMFDASSVGYQK